MTPTPRPVSLRALGAGLAVLAALGVTGCGQQTTDTASAGAADVAAPESGTRTGTTTGTATGGETPPERERVVRLAPGEARPRLVCPTDARSMMIADFAQGAEGAATPEEAVGPPDLVRTGEQLVLGARGTRAWVLRADGTARMEIGLIHDQGWLLHQRTSCG